MTFQKGNKIWSGRKHLEETKRKISKAKMGHIVLEETRNKIGKSMRGKKHSEKTKEKMSEAKIGDKNPSKRPKVIAKILKSRKWYKHSEETKRKMSISQKGRTYEEIFGEEKAEQIKKKISKSLKGKFAGDNNPSKKPEVKKKIRKSMIKYIKETRGNIYPNIGKNEKQILDELELSLGFKIYRQFEVEGYFIDGYIPKLKLAIEIDEKKFHGKNKTKRRDKTRQKEIKKALGCKFIRIKDNFMSR